MTREELVGAFGRIGFSRLEAVSYGQPAAKAVTAEVKRLGRDRVFLLTSSTLNRETDEVSKLRRALGDRVVGIYAEMAPHTPRGRVIEVVTAARVTNAIVEPHMLQVLPTQFTLTVENIDST